MSEVQIKPLKEIVQRIRDSENGTPINVLTISSTQGWVSQKDRWARNMAGDSLAKYTKIQKGDFSYNRGNSKTYPYGCMFRLNDFKDAVVPNVYHSFRIRDDGVDSDFLQQFFWFGGLDAQLKGVLTSSVRDNGLLNITSETFFSLEISLPPLPEQKKIAAILTSVDDVIETTQKQIDKLQDLKKATMNELLTKGIGHTDFKDSELGEIPESWEVKALGDYVKLQGGNAFPSSSFSENGVPVVRISNIVDGIVDMSKCIYFAESERFRNFVVCKGDILLAMSGATTGKVGVYWNNFESYLNQRVGRFKVLNKEKVAPLFLKHLVQSSIFSEATLRDAIGGAQPNISSSQVESVMYAFPPIGEQNLISSTLGAIDQQIEIKRQKLTQTQSLKKSLMQDLLTGKVRVKVD
mgnify:CR=1 FL=1|tara:strand:+ start:50 stop:1273 length:1224 start_codon:yes stop_codon:yes gene_type:complete